MQDSIASSSRLCSVILNKHLSSEEKLALIKSLLSDEGADINFQDKNRNGDSPLHCSVRCDDLLVLNLLLEHRADPLLRNDEQVTASDLAETFEKDDMLQSLLPHCSTGDGIPRDFISACPFKKVYEKIKQSDFNHSHYKILKIETRTSKIDVLNLMKEERFYKEFNQSSYWFITIFTISESIENVSSSFFTPLVNLFSNHKPCIVQLNHRQVRKIYYKDVGVDGFKQALRKPIEENELSREIETNENKLQFELILQFSLRKKDDLTSAKLNLKQLFNGKRIIDHAVTTNSSLLIRFLMLFQWDLKYKKEGQKRVLELAAEYGNGETMRALFDFPFKPIIAVVEFLRPSSYASEAAELLNRDGDSPIFIACKRGSREALDCLLHSGVKTKRKFKKKQIELSDIAWKDQRYEHLKSLLDADKCFPNEEKIKLLEVDSLKKLVEERDGFHKNISDDDIEAVKSYVETYFLKFCYNSSNESALTTAFISKSYQSCAYLTSKQFQVGKHEDSVEKHIKLIYDIKKDKEKFLSSRRKYFEKVESSHIINLYSHSIDTNIEKPLPEKMLALYQELDKVREVSLVMKVLQGSMVTIFFDFKNETIGKMYHRESHENIDKARGAHNSSTNEIFIAGKRKTSEVLGTLAHEMTHMAIQICFGNDCKPYERYSNTEKVFKTIIGIVEKHTDAHEIIKNALSYGNKDVACELIVRVNHLLAQYPSEREKFELSYKELFNFYNKHVAKRLQSFVEDPEKIKIRLESQNVNSSFGNLQSLTKEIITFQNVSSFDFMKPFESYNFQIIWTRNPHLTVFEFYQYLNNQFNDFNDISASYIFIKAHNLKDKIEMKKIVDISTRHANKFIIIELGEVIDDRVWTNFFSSLRRSCRFILVTQQCANIYKIFDKLTKLICKIHSEEFSYGWESFNEETKKEMLLKPVNYQGAKTVLEKVLPCDAKAREKLINTINQIDTLLDKTSALQINVHKLPFDEYDTCHFIPRDLYQNLSRNLWKCSTTAIEEVFEKARSEKIMILSDNAGMGKSILLTHLSRQIKKLYPSYWVIRMSLTKDNLEMMAEKLSSNSEKSCEFYIKFLELETDFEKALLRTSYDEDKLLLFFDGVNEVKMEEDQIVEAVKIIAATKYGQLWITTRTSLQEKLEKAVNKKSIKLEEFNRSDQIQFLENYWHNPDYNQSLGVEKSKVYTNLKDFAKVLIEKISNCLGRNEKKFIGIPLQTRMVAEIFKEQVFEMVRSGSKPAEINIKEKIDLNWLYKQFLNAKIFLWVSRNHNSVLNDSVDMMKYGWRRHQQLSIQYHFGRSQVKNLNENFQIKGLSNSCLADMGIVYIRRVPKFSHQTYAEYFIADYVVDIMLEPVRKANKTEFLKIIFSNAKCALVRNFINSFIRHYKPAKIDQGKKVLVESFTSFFDHQTFACIVKENLVDIIKCIMRFHKSIKCPPRCRPVINTAIMFRSFESLEVLLRSFKPEFKNHFIHGKSILHVAIQNDYIISELEKLFDLVAKVFKEEKNAIFDINGKAITSILKLAGKKGINTEAIIDICKKISPLKINRKRKAITQFEFLPPVKYLKHNK